MSALDPPSYQALPDDEQKFAGSSSSSSSSSSSTSSSARKSDARHGRSALQSPSTSTSSSSSRRRSRSPRGNDNDDDDDDTRGILDSDDELMEELITLVAQGGEEFSLPRRFCGLSEYLKNLLEGDNDAATIQLAKLTPSQTLKVVAYLTHWGKKENDEPVNLEPPIESSDLVNIAGAWCADFVDTSQAELFELFLASNYLGIRPLVSLCAAKIACDMHEKSPSEIQNLYNIRDDFTEEEELEVRRTYREFIE